MVQCPWTVNWFAASQENPRISRNPKFHHRNHKRPLPESILDQTNPVHITTFHLLKIHLYYEPLYAYGSPLVSFPPVPTPRPYTPPSPRPYAPHAQPISFFSNLSTQYFGWGINIIYYLVIQSPPFSTYLFPPTSKYSPQHNILKQPQLPFLLQYQRLNFTPIPNKRQNYNSILLDFYICG